MSNIPIRDITQSGTPDSTSLIVFDNGTMRKGTVASMADAVRPVATQSESTAGSDNAKTMTPLRVKQSITSEVGVSIQGYSANLGNFAGKTAPSGVVVGTTDAQTLTNKTLTSPSITSPTGLVKGDIGLGNVANADTTNAANISSGTLPAARLPALTGDVTTTVGTVATTIANNAVTNAKLAQIPASSFKGNSGTVPGTATDFTIGSLTVKASPAGTDEVVIADNAAGGAFKRTPVSALAGGGGSVSSYNGLTGAVAAPSDAAIYVSASGNDANNGLSPESAKLTLQAAVNAANPGRNVYAGNGTFTLASALQMQPGVVIFGQRNTVITQANSAGLSNLVDFSTNTAHGAGFVGCKIYGNRGNNTDNVNHIMVNLGAAQDVVLDRNTFRDATGTLVELKDSVRAIVTNNIFTNFYVIGIGLNPTNAQTANTAFISQNRFNGVMGQHCLYTKWSDRNTIVNNKFDCDQWFGVVNTSSTTVTYVSGRNFAGLTTGNFFTVNGVEYLINNVASNTSLTLNSSAGTQSNKTYVAGTGDIVSVGNSSNNLIQGNEVIGGGAGGIVIHQFYGGQVAQGNTVVGNTVRNSAQACISVVAAAINGSSQLVATQVTGNYIVDGGRGVGAIASLVNCGIYVADGGSALNVLTSVTNNFVRDTTASTGFGINCSGLAIGFTFMGGNVIYNAGNQGVGNSFGPVSLGGGWGSGASISDAINFGDKFYFRVIPGSGPAANPALSLPFAVTGNSNPRLYCVKAYDNNGQGLNVIGDLPPNTSGTLSLTVIGFTPTTGVAVLIQGSC